MKRRLFMLALLLFAGAVLNVAVAWGCAAWSGCRATGPAVAGEWAEQLARDSERHCPPSPDTRQPVQLDQFPERTTHPIRAIGAACCVVYWGEGNASAESTVYLVAAQAGWPVPSMRGEMWILSDGAVLQTTRMNRRVLTAALRIRETTGATPNDQMTFLAGGRLLPLRPQWDGFTLNTTLYASILWVAGAMPLVMRRLIRRRRNLCVHCGYNLRGAAHERCPECGAAAAPR